MYLYYIQNLMCTPSSDLNRSMFSTLIVKMVPFSLLILNLGEKEVASLRGSFLC